MNEKEAQEYVEYMKSIDPNFKNDAFEVMLWSRMVKILTAGDALYREDNQ